MILLEHKCKCINIKKRLCNLKCSISYIYIYIYIYIYKHGIPDAPLLEWKFKLKELINNKIVILKTKGTHEHLTGTSS